MQRANSKTVGTRNKVTLYFLLLAATIMSGEQTGVSYKDLQELGVSCYPLDSCKMSRNQDRLDNYNCNCDERCAIWDTCCVDSPFLNSVGNSSRNIIPVCSKVYGKLDYVFMVGHCSQQWAGDNATEKLCLDDGEKSNDPLLIVPVTNLQTGITYENYFCSLCNEKEDSDELLFWHVLMSSESEAFSAILSPVISYSQTLQSWIITDDNENDRFAPVSLSVEVPETLRAQLRWCRPGVISDCSPLWNDDATKEKCKAYTAIILVYNNGTNMEYKNVHCAICNYQTFEDMQCSTNTFERSPMKLPKFLRIFDLNSVNTGRKQCEKPSVYDPLAKKCRVVKCIRSDYVLRNGKCVKVNA
ncbi:hypothetical protein X975_15734, partial [Stegodyphus mimosarum]